MGSGTKRGIHRGRRVALQFLAEMRVDVARERIRRVTEHLLDRAERHALSEQQRSAGVPEAVEPHPRERPELVSFGVPSLRCNAVLARRGEDPFGSDRSFPSVASAKVSTC